MTKKEPIIIDGQKIGKMKASWLLFKEAWRYLRSDKEMIFIPLLTTLMNIFLFGIITFIFVIVVNGGDFRLSEEGEPASAIEIVFLFAVYVIGAFTLALSQAGITNTVFTRVHGGDATLGNSMKAAFSHSSALLIWSVITSTIGVLLRMVAERSGILGRIVTSIFGVGWSVLTYFVVPAIVIDKKSALSSISKSGQVFRSTWGETIVSNISLGLTFLLAHLLVFVSVVGLIIFALASNITVLVFVLVALYIIWFILAILVQASLEGVLKTLLYVYATENIVPPNFSAELLDKMMSRKAEDTEVSTGQSTFSPNV